jgi:hypothetical protein
MAVKSPIILAGLIVVLCSACRREPRLDVKLKQDGTNYVIDVVDCADGTAFGVDAIAVYQGGVGICGVRRTLGPGVMPLTSWKYGTQPKGYVLSECRKPVAGTEFSIQAERGAFASRKFLLRNDGSVINLNSTCLDTP